MFLRRRINPQAPARAAVKAITIGCIACAAFACWAQTGADPASNYPNRPIRLIVQFPPGTTTDIVARVIAEKLIAAWGHQVIIDNRGGAGGTLGTEIGSRATPDGYSLTMAPTGAMGIAPALYPNLAYDVLRDFAPITNVVSQAQVLIANPAIPVRSVGEMVEYARSRPGAVAYGSVGAGTATHLAMEMLQNSAKVKLNHIPFKGSPPAQLEVISGRVQVMFDGLPAALPMIKSGKVRGIAVSSLQRQKFAPELPTIAESGFPGFEAIGWGGVVAPAKTPPAILDKLNGEIVRIVNLPDVRERLNIMGFNTIGDTRAQFTEFMRAEIAKWQRVVREAGVKLDN